MINRTIDDLIFDLKQRRTSGDKPPVLLLGAGASVESGIGAMTDLFAFAKCADFDAFVKYIAPQTTAERFRLLSQFLQTRKPAQVTFGYQALATLCAEAYFDLVLTLNLDPLLDDALAYARLWRKDYLVIVNGIYRPDRLAPVLSAQSPRVKIVKMHGDLFHRFMAWTPEEMDAYVSEIAARLDGALYGRDLLVVGTSLRDERIRELTLKVVENGGAVWYTGPTSAPDFLQSQSNVRAVLGPDCTFENLFTRIATDVGVMKLPAPGPAAEPSFDAEAATASQTMDDFMASLVSVLGPDDKPSSTGFLLASPRVIVADAYPTRPMIVNGRVKIAASGKTYTAEVLNSDVGHPFGPVFLKPPPELQIATLFHNPAPLEIGRPISAGIAAGGKTGIASGTVSAQEATIAIDPIGQVPDLVQLQLAVAQGASGAPVVDDSFIVRGFIVAGSTDPNNPISYMYPASRWAKDLKSIRGRLK